MKMTLEEKIKLFKKFALKHEVRMLDKPGNNGVFHIYCADFVCDKCCIQEDCHGFNPFFSDDELKIVKEKFPEYFI